MKTLQSILQGIANPSSDLLWHQPVLGITADSREVRPGWIFFARSGFQADGHAFIPEAIQKGALAVVAEKRMESGTVPVIQVQDIRKAIAAAASRYYEVHFNRMTLIGITGTNGKTTSAYMTESVFKEAGLTTGLIGTVQYRWADQVRSAVRTTPDAIEIYRLLNEMSNAGVQVVVMEISSHALSLDRVLGLPFKAAVYTNLSRDHLDFHETFEAYAEAKSRLFAMLGSDSVGVINADDSESGRMQKMCTGRTVLFGERGSALDYRIRDVRISEAGSYFTLSDGKHDSALFTPLWGGFNVTNAAGVSVAAIELGCSVQAVQNGLKTLRNIPGRMEGIQSASGFRVVVDYAHTPDALENVLKTARGFTSGKLIAVFGCGGDRDKGKRPQMGRIGEQLADRVFVTSDNPRSEDPEAIIREILTGIRDRSGIGIIADRRQAIAAAIRSASEGDTVVIAGKGHETYQEIKGKRTHFDDKEVALSVLNEVENG